jgi:hypothetical protein
MKKLLILLFIIIPSIILSQINNDIRIAVLDFGTSGGLSDMEAVTLTNRLRSMLVKTNAFVVLERGKMDEILSEQGFQQTGCTTTECAVEVGKMLNVQKMVSGTIGKLGRTWTMDISLIDVGTSQIEKSFFQDYKGEIDALLTVMESVANQIANIAGKERKVTIEVGKLEVNVEPLEAEIILDNKKVGNSPLLLENVIPGKHILQINASGYDSHEQEINITKEKPTVLNINLKKIFNLSVKSNPSEADIYINNIKIGQTPFNKKVVEDDKMQISLTKLNYKEWKESFVIKKDVEINPNLEYTEAYKESLIKTFVISIKSNPIGAQILLNNKNAGVTPFESKVKEGVRLQIKLRKKNYEEWAQNITVRDNVDINASLDFSQEYKDELAARAKKEREEKQVGAVEESGSTWWWIGGGVIVAGGAAAILLSGKENGEPEPEPAPSFPIPPGRP